MHIISRSGDICKGYILAVHGLPQEFAAWADRMTLNELGVGLNRVTHIPGTREILSLGAEGKISKGLPS